VLDIGSTLLNDRPFPEAWSDIQPNAVVIVDGVFLLRRDLRQYWDYSIWLQIDWDTMIERATKRDVAWVGSAEEVAERYREFWIPTHRFYETGDDPRGFATIIVDNQRPETPIVFKGGSAGG
jgi:uridine kinase